MDPAFILDRHIDVIFSHEVPDRVKASVLGDEASDRTSPSKLRPSDHASLAAELSFH